MAIDGFYEMPLKGLRYRDRIHPSVQFGKRQTADTLVLHWSAGSKDLEALHKFFSSRQKEASYNWAIDRFGSCGEFIPPKDASWHAGDGWLPSATELLDRGFVPVDQCPEPPPRAFNLRSAGLCFCNRGPVTPGTAVGMARKGQPVIEAKHANPLSQSRYWEAYTADALTAFQSVLGSIVEALPTLRIVTGHEDVTNSWIRGKGKPSGGSKIDPGPAFPWEAFPWHRWGLTVIRYDYKAHGWRAFARSPDAAVA